MERTLAQAAAQLGLTRPKLITLMREKGLLKGNLPADLKRDKEYLRVKDRYDEKYGLQYSQSTRVRQAGIRWLADQLDIDLPAIPADRRDVA
ncbi:phage antirepressor KilAC domain-containing protein [Pseudomonas frederiksbergensis]|uniref:phage antirepressor KilAC domain-containing protein n=1 Tax=Pseudomonas frederiksbergensis TaxID=104087 RepID=UPI003D1AFC51